MSILVHLLPRRNIIAFLVKIAILIAVLKLLHDRFYIPMLMEQAEREIETCHQQLIEHLKNRGKTGAPYHGRIEPDRRGTLYGQFPLRVRIALEMVNELNHFEMDRHPSPEERAEMDA